MLTADEARRMAKENEIGLTKELNEIEKNIEESVLLGCFYITRAGYLSSVIERYLKKIGYKIEINNHDGFSYYTISWDE